MTRPVLALLVATLLLPLSQVMPVSLSAGIFCNHGVNPCATCNPCRTCYVNPCRCQAPAPQVTMRPQVQTTPVVTYRDVTRTEFRLQAETQAVPVTAQQSVTVDEGGWQKIWVPKLVQKTVPITTYQQQTVYRQVPHQVTQRVPQVSYQTTTRMIPQVTGTAVTGCGSCGAPRTTWNAYPPAGTITGLPVLGTPTAIPGSIVSGPTTLPMTPSQQPIQLGRELQPLDSLASPKPSSTTGPVPDPAYLEIPQASNSASDDGWTPVLAVNPSSGDESSPAPSNSGSAPRVGSSSGKFVPAPSAASVWRTRVR